jgi:predicted Zn-dependent protease
VAADGKQFSANAILTALARDHLPADAFTCIAVTTHDIYTTKLSWVYGLASLADRVGIHRYA